MYQKSKSVLSTELDGEICLFHVETANYLNLNSTASFIWKQINEAFSINYVINILLDEFDIDKQTCEIETKEFISQCLNLKMIESV